MNIWQWVLDTARELRANGHSRLAQLIDQIPGLVCDGRHAQAEAVIPEAVALARALDHPWLEVFFRHWLMQSRILHRCDLTNGLDEVVHLLDFAHGERTSDCPQTVCVTQDLGAAYGLLDGPGYCAERLAVSTETLARINPSWPCFDCISAERAAALLDARHFEDAEQFCRAQLSAAAEQNVQGLWYVQNLLASSLIAQRRFQEALTVLDQMPSARSESTREVTFRLKRSRTLAELGRVEEAIEAFAGADRLDPEHFVAWGRCVRKLVQLGAIDNNPDLGARAYGFARRLRRNDARWSTGRMLKIAAELAILRDAHGLARLCLQDAGELLQSLRRPERLAAQIDALMERLPVENIEVPEDIDSWLDQLDKCAERALPALMHANVLHPDHEHLACKLSSAYRACGFAERAERLLREFVSRHEEARRAYHVLARNLLDDGAHQHLKTLADEAPASMQAMALWYLARSAQHKEQFDEAIEALERARAIEPESLPVRSLLAEMLRRKGHAEQSLDLLDELVCACEPGHDDWERMVVATQLGAHEKVRDSARRLGFKFEEGTGPIDEPYAYCDVHLRDGHGRSVVHRALRISPVTARIISISGPGQREVYHDTWLFDPVVLNPLETTEDSEDAAEHVPGFRSIQMLSQGGYRSYELDGFHPGEDALAALRASLDAVGARLSVRSTQRYQLERPGEDSRRPGIYAFIAVPEFLPSLDLHALLRQQVSNWPLPVTYRSLLRELDLQQELAEQESWAEEFELDD